MNNNEQRHMVVVPEKQERIEKIDQAYTEMQLDNSGKKKTLEAVGKALKIASAAVGVITVIDWIVPDPVLGIDEIALTAITGLLGTASTIVSNKAAQLEATGRVDMSVEEVSTLAQQIGNTRDKVAASRAQMKK